MPRIREIKVGKLAELIGHTNQWVEPSARIEITSYPSDDLLRAVGADYADECSHISATSDIGAAWQNGFGYSAAGLLSGATECAHVDAVCWAHAFNDRGVIRSGSYVADTRGRRGQVTRTPHSPADLGPTVPGMVKVCYGSSDVRVVATSDLRAVPFYDPRRDVYGSPDWAAWETYHCAHGTVCPSCSAVNYGDDSYSPESCDNCLAKLPKDRASEDLNDVMEFDHVVEVREDGSIIDRDDIYAPEVCWDGHLGIDFCGHTDWAALDGYSGQDRYSGPIMHDSEYVGGRMEADIRETPGIYVAVVINDVDDLEHPAGWAVLRLDSKTEVI